MPGGSEADPAGAREQAERGRCGGSHGGPVRPPPILRLVDVDVPDPERGEIAEIRRDACGAAARVGLEVDADGTP